MNKLTASIIGLFLMLTLLIFTVHPASAQGQNPIIINNSTVQADYPANLTFSCHAQSNTNITDIKLEYQVEQMSFAQVTAETEATFNPSSSVSATYSLNMQQYGQIPPGVIITYCWVVRDSAGNEIQSDQSHYTVVDNHHSWNNLTQGKINLYWYGQNQTFGNTITTEAQSALTTLANDTGATPEKTVNITIYTSPQDYAASVAGAPEWAGGEELSQYNCILLMVRPEALSSDLPGVAHELTHVIVGQITFNPYNSIPFWLNEGLAVHIQFPQGNVPSAFTTALSNAIANNSFISVRSLSDPFSAVTNKAYLSYAESVSIVTYLINQYGAAKMNQLLDTFQQGTTYDGALKTIYGFDMDGLFTQWKTWVNTENGKQPIY